MSCQKSLTLNQAISDMDNPFDAACYVSSVDKIFATMGPYVCKCNADTGAVEAAVLVSSPAEGPCGICYHTIKDMVYVSVRDGKSGIYYTLTRPERDIFPVDPATMTVGAGLGVYGLLGDASGDVSQGPLDLVYNGDNYIYFTWLAEHASGGSALKRIDPDNIAGFAGYDISGPSYGDNPNAWIQFGINPPNEIYWIIASAFVAVFEDIGGVDSGQYDYSGVYTDVQITACEYSPINGHTYCVGGNRWMLDITSYTPEVGAPIDLNTIPGVTNANPLHVRYNAGKIYIPSPGGGQVIIYDPILATWDVRNGFASPIDVVFTPTKAFAVQNSSVGLEEII